MPPKQKKQPRNSYYFYMIKRREELEREGHRFPGGMKDVAHAVGAEWASMTAEEKMPFEELARVAKEEGKLDMNNKFTSTGESYAQVQRRIQEDKQMIEEQETYITELGYENGALDRVFILIKTIHCVEQIIERNQRIYWPIEVGMVAFTLRDGLQSIYWTLIDTQKTPVGYASAAKECSEETGLPEPGTPAMKDYRDYNKIMKHIQGFIRHWTKQGYRRGPVVFALDQETEQARGCLKWIVNHVDDERRKDHQIFVDTLKFYKLPKLILRLAEYANRLDPSYTNVLVSHKLELSAASIVNKGCYDYKDEITCMFHREEKASLKMFTCCRNVVLRRMYLLYEEFLPAFGLEKANRHDMQKLKEAQIAKARANAAATAKMTKSGPSTDHIISADPGASSSFSPKSQHSSTSSYRSSRRDTRDSDRIEDDDVVSDSSSGRYNKRPHGDGGDWSNDRRGPPSKRDSFTSDRGSRDLRDDSPSPPPPTSTYRRLPPEPEDDYVPKPTAEFTPWGNKRPVIEPNFGAADFPSLGSISGDPPMMMTGPKPGAGRGRGTIKQDTEDDNGPIWGKGKDARQYY